MSSRIGGREPDAAPARRTRMRRLALTCAATVLLLAGCGTEAVDNPDTATAPTTSTTPTPTAEPTVGTYPAYGPTDYTYTLTVGCFCVGGGAPIAITVVDGEVTTAVYADGSGRGADAGAEVDESQRLTIDDVIDRANDTTADQVEVDWPDGQDYPNSVRIDRAAEATDDEVEYAIADVVPTT